MSESTNDNPFAPDAPETNSAPEPTKDQPLAPVKPDKGVSGASADPNAGRSQDKPAKKLPEKDTEKPPEKDTEKPPEPPVSEKGVLPHLGVDAVDIHEDLKPVVQVMFDGGIHDHRSQWEMREHILGELVDGIFDAMKSYQGAGYHVHVSTDRAQSQSGLTAVFNWMGKQGIEIKCLHRCSIDVRVVSGAVVTVTDKDHPCIQEPSL